MLPCRLGIERQNHDGFEKRLDVLGVLVGVLAVEGAAANRGLKRCRSGSQSAP